MPRRHILSDFCGGQVQVFKDVHSTEWKPCGNSFSSFRVWDSNQFHGCVSSCTISKDEPQQIVASRGRGLVFSRCCTVCKDELPTEWKALWCQSWWQFMMSMLMHVYDVKNDSNLWCESWFQRMIPRSQACLVRTLGHCASTERAGEPDENWRTLDFQIL